MRAPLAFLSFMLCAGASLCAEPFVLPSLPTEEEVSALPEEEFARRASAMKTVLVLHYLQTEDDEFTITRGNYMACSALAERLGAPTLFSQLFAALSAEYVSSAEYSEWSNAIETLCALYGVDVMAIKFFVDNNDGARGVAPIEISDELLSLPLDQMFNLASNRMVTSQQCEEALLVLCASYEWALQQYQMVADAPTARKTALQLQSLLARVAEAQWVISQAKSQSPHILNSQLTEKFNRIYAAFNAEMKRLKEQNCYGVSTLKVINRCLEYYVQSL